MTNDEISSEIKRIKEYAVKENIPIIQDEGIDFLTSFIAKKGIRNILEIGTAIGYSAIKMCLVDNDVYVTTIERDVERYNIAIKNINDFNLNDRINVILGDALEVELDDKNI